MGEIEKDISTQVLREILGLVHKCTGITMSEKKKNLLQTRLRPRMKELDICAYSDYLAYFSANPKEAQEFINLVTTNETLFFRTPRVWEFFEKNIGNSPLRIWSAATSSGEEAYSIAMLGRENQLKRPGFALQVCATDISTEVLELAQKGVYSGRSFEDLNHRFPERVAAHFVNEGEGHCVRPELRSAVKFSVHSLFDSPQRLGQFDIVFLRNVMIYFNEKDQEKVLNNVIQTIKPGGILVLGESESLSRFKTALEFVEPLIYKKGGA